MIPCVFCDLDFDTMQLLARHLVSVHQGRLVRGGTNALGDSYWWTSYWVRCWCGREFAKESAWGSRLDVPDSPFARHLRDRGGLAAHLLEMALLDKEESRDRVRALR